MRKTLILLWLVLSLVACHQSGSHVSEQQGDTLRLKYAENLTIVRYADHAVVELKNPWKAGTVLRRYVLCTDSSQKYSARGATVVQVPLKRAVVFTTAHASLLAMLHQEGRLAGVCDSRYMLLPWVHEGIRRGTVADCGSGMSPDVEKIIELKPDGLFVSPFENSGGYGRLEDIRIPLIETADYMETSALGRAEWMKFYGMLFGCESQADSLFAVVEKNYRQLRQRASKSRTRMTVIPDRKTGSVWYMPGGRSSVGRLYQDANVGYAFSRDTHSGSLALPFETVLDKAGDADVWILSYNGAMTRRQLLAEYSGYGALKAFKKGAVYGVSVDRTPYFEEVSFRPDWLLRDYLILFHPDLHLGATRYYKQLP